MAIIIDMFDAQYTTAFVDQLGTVYEAAFAAQPYNRDAHAAHFFVVDTLPRHFQRDDFRCCIAHTTADGTVVGFAYGYTGDAGQWWTDAVAAHMSPNLAAEWLPGHFEFVELAVLPTFHGQGIGERLHNRLLAGLPHRRALLSTAQQWTPARALYDKRGWHVLVSEFFFIGTLRPYVIMGKILEPLRR